jgi:DNA-binding HxlR family transcriptional regulator
MSPGTTRHFEVPTLTESRHACLGPEGSVAHVTRVVRMIQGRWKLPILFRLYADPFMRTLQLRRDLPGIAQKVLTEQLREMAADGLIERVDYHEKPRRVEYRLSPMGRRLLPVLVAAREFSLDHPGAMAVTP